MKVTRINGYYPQNLCYKHNSKQISEKTENKSINFNGNVSTYLMLSNPRFKNLIGQKYRIFNSHIKVLSPQGEEIDAVALVQDGLMVGKRNLDIILTDSDCYALGEVSSSLSTIGYSEPKNILITAIRNYTRSNKGEKLDFMEPTMETRSKDTDGIYQRIGTELYKNLEQYIKKYHSDIKMFLANITTNESWNFHRACGFTLDAKGHLIPDIDACDTYLPYGNNLYRVLQ